MKIGLGEGIGNSRYFERRFCGTITSRYEFFDDRQGQRIGTKTKYSEHLLGWGHWIGARVLFRPELRLEHSYDRPAFDPHCLPCCAPGTKSTQFTFPRDANLFF